MPGVPSLNRRILCVDDDTESTEVLREILCDYTLTCAATAFEAIRAINTRFFHAYILDYWLPDWTGVQLSRAIRETDPHGPIIFCTAAARDEDRKRALRSGANAYFCKPIDPERLRRQLRVHIELSELESLRAKTEEELAVTDELKRRLSNALSRAEAARHLATEAMERTVRTKAYRAFVEARGTRAHFESWWPNVFGSARASEALGCAEPEGPPPNLSSPTAPG
jgi:DNA-binding response OmpR family regulator